MVNKEMMLAAILDGSAWCSESEVMNETLMCHLFEFKGIKFVAYKEIDQEFSADFDLDNIDFVD